MQAALSAASGQTGRQQTRGARRAKPRPRGSTEEGFWRPRWQSLTPSSATRGRRDLPACAAVTAVRLSEDIGSPLISQIAAQVSRSAGRATLKYWLPRPRRSPASDRYRARSSPCRATRPKAPTRCPPSGLSGQPADRSSAARHDASCPAPRHRSAPGMNAVTPIDTSSAFAGIRTPLIILVQNNRTAIDRTPKL